jgi:hypothetical protein
MSWFRYPHGVIVARFFVTGPHTAHGHATGAPSPHPSSPHTALAIPVEGRFC